MSDLNKIKIIQSLSKLYLSLFAINFVAGKPAEKESDAKTEKADTSASKTDTSDTSSKTETSTDNKTEASTDNKTEASTDNKTSTTATSDSVGVSKVPPLNQRTKCQPNTQSCDEGYSCIRFNGDGEDNFTCIKTELAFCDSGEYCKNKLGSNFKYCYLPPWASSNERRQCFTEQVSGSHCLFDIHCVNSLSCIDKVCVSSTVGNLDDTTNTNGMDFDTKQKSNGTILGINKWIFISAVSFPVLVLILCIWCWLIGRSSSKRIENTKKQKYEKELKELTIPGERKGKNENEANASTTQYVNPQKEIEEEVGKRGFRSLFSKKKKEEEVAKVEENKDDEDGEQDIANSKVGSKSPISTASTTNTQQKRKSNLTLVSLTEKNGAPRPRKNAGMKSPSTPASSVASFANSTTSSAQGKRIKKKTGGKKTKKAVNTDASNSTSSKQSSQRGLVNNASNMSSALSGQSASYFSTVSSLDPQSAIYYQQMYAQAAAAQNQYYASYMQNPYYAAAAQAAAAQTAAYYGQDPNALYNYQNQPGYQ